MAEKPEAIFIATNASFPGYWGKHADGPHHAIVECMSAGASAGSVFVVYDAYEGCYFSDFGSMVYLVEHGKPEVEGVYDATGIWLGSSLLEVAKDCRDLDYWIPEHPLIDKETIKSLKKHADQETEAA